MGGGNIAGIHNYCDRWCERCCFTSRCAAFAEAGDLPSDQRDIRNKAFWQRLGDNISKAKGALEQAAERLGVDMKAIHVDVEASEKQEKRIREESNEHPISKLSLAYSEMATQWLKTQPGMLDRLDTLKTELTIGVQSHQEAKEETVVIKDGLAVIHWYCTFIHIKLMRALMGKFDDYGISEAENNFPRDFDGSAKIALIGIERSMQAWVALFQILPDNEDDFLKILSLLEKLKKMVRAEFPGAEEFIRPGFDDNQ